MYNKIISNTELKELREHGSPHFPFAYYYEDIYDFIDHKIDYHYHNEFEVVYLLEGSYRARINKEEFTVNKGDILFINSNALHEFIADKSSIIPNILFSPGLLSLNTYLYDKYIRKIIDSNVAYILTNDPILQQSMEEIMKYSEENNELMLLSLTFKIIEVIYQMIEGKTQAQIDKRIYIMLEYIHNNCSKDISLDDLCRSINVSRNTVTNIFMKYMNEGFSSYLNKYRLKKAIILLRSDMNISEISSKIGYNSVGYFVKKFKSFYGITPGEYRKKYQ